MDGSSADPRVRSVIDQLMVDGYTERFRVDGDGALCCQVCGMCQPPTEAAITQVRPVGTSVVLVASCPACWARGIAITTKPDDATGGRSGLLTGLADTPIPTV